MCLVCVCVCLCVCVFVCCGMVKKREKKKTVCTMKTPPCVHSKRPRVYRQQAHMFHTCGLGAGTHGDVLNVHTESVLNLHTAVIASSAYQEKLT